MLLGSHVRSTCFSHKAVWRYFKFPLIIILLTTMAAPDTPHSLLSHARKYNNIPEDCRGTPWFNDGNIFLFTNDKAFKFYMGFLRAPDNAPRFEERLQNLSDDSVDVVYDHPALQVDDSSEDLGYFLTAIYSVSGR
jgi:hypothetical protein